MGNFAVAASEEVIRQGNELLNELSKGNCIEPPV